ncbi:hypothetical protein BUALT_Bualt03G0088200 [Buddleja alternifolia]|uniref:Uncharacterized protein n=1 Tax=Buddleja alternifolia TaxID=168488 RepID=A0AAV6XS60_9LAMI|nr:hypothetical protein BUALT_Bualt03G0088200 [Buddleja alternifolia]
MVREADHSGGVTLSSIALLQERFRQLEKMKELRQEKELLRMLSDQSERYSPPIMHYEPKHLKTCLSSEMMMMMFVPPKPHECQLSLSLWPDSQIKHADFRGTRHQAQAPSNLAKSWFADDAPNFVSTRPNKIENSDDYHIDTSLRL